ncbi:MAG: hypothetical protein WAO83_14505 [Fuerstiella sp.]
MFNLNTVPPDSHVLLETVATCAHKGEESSASGAEPRLRDQARGESQKLLASFADTSDAICDA